MSRTGDESSGTPWFAAFARVSQCFVYGSYPAEPLQQSQASRLGGGFTLAKAQGY